MNLSNRTILITGGSAGIGLAFALKFAELGNEVIVTGRRQKVLEDVKARHPKLHTIQSDVADPAQIAALAARVKADFPKLDRPRRINGGGEHQPGRRHHHDLRVY